jgi:DNA-binding NarL/FixJ family response regulator
MRLLRRLVREQERSSRPAQGPPAPALTAQELEVLRLLALGQTNREIAQSILSSVSTVKAHVRSTISKLGVSDRTQAAVRAIQLGLATSGIES